MKKKDRWILLAVSKQSCEVQYAHCECPSGKAGTCSHSFALMKLFAKWVIDNLSEIPSQKACTSRACIWSMPQSRDRVDKTKISEITIKQPKAIQNKKRKSKTDSENATQKSSQNISKGINST